MITSYTPSPNLIALITEDEGIRSRAYQDTKGNWTIGVGRNLTFPGLSINEQIFLLRRLEIPQEIINFLLLNDLERTAHQVSGLVGDAVWSSLSDARQAALINMGFMGVKSLEYFQKMLQAIRSGDWETAKKECLNSKWASDVGPHRSNRVGDMLLTGEWVSGSSSADKEGND